MKKVCNIVMLTEILQSKIIFDIKIIIYFKIHTQKNMYFYFYILKYNTLRLKLKLMILYKTHSPFPFS